MEEEESLGFLEEEESIGFIEEEERPISVVEEEDNSMSTSTTSTCFSFTNTLAGGKRLELIIDFDIALVYGSFWQAVLTVDACVFMVYVNVISYS